MQKGASAEVVEFRVIPPGIGGHGQAPMRSIAAGERQPMAECNRHGLYQPSIHPNRFGPRELTLWPALRTHHRELEDGGPLVLLVADPLVEEGQGEEP